MTDSKIKAICKSLVVLVDTRENENSHIINFFKQKGIKYEEKKLDFGDYSFYCPPIPEIGFDDITSFEKSFVIERKANLTELSGNIAQQRERFENEIERAEKEYAKFILMVEDSSYDGILQHKYRTDLNEKAYLATLLSYQHRYNLNVQFISKQNAGLYIYSQFFYRLRHELKDIQDCVIMK